MTTQQNPTLIGTIRVFLHSFSDTDIRIRTVASTTGTTSFWYTGTIGGYNVPNEIVRQNNSPVTATYGKPGTSEAERTIRLDVSHINERRLRPRMYQTIIVDNWINVPYVLNVFSDRTIVLDTPPSTSDWSDICFATHTDLAPTTSDWSDVCFAVDYETSPWSDICFAEQITATIIRFIGTTTFSRRDVADHRGWRDRRQTTITMEGKFADDTEIDRISIFHPAGALRIGRNQPFPVNYTADLTQPEVSDPAIFRVDLVDLSSDLSTFISVLDSKGISVPSEAYPFAVTFSGAIDTRTNKILEFEQVTEPTTSLWSDICFAEDVRDTSSPWSDICFADSPGTTPWSDICTAIGSIDTSAWSDICLRVHSKFGVQTSDWSDFCQAVDLPGTITPPPVIDPRPTIDAGLDDPQFSNILNLTATMGRVESVLVGGGHPGRTEYERVVSHRLTVPTGEIWVLTDWPNPDFVRTITYSTEGVLAQGTYVIGYEVLGDTLTTYRRTHKIILNAGEHITATFRSSVGFPYERVTRLGLGNQPGTALHRTVYHDEAPWEIDFFSGLSGYIFKPAPKD